MNFESIPMILSGNLYRAAHVSATRGDRKLKELAACGAIQPVKTPTGRTLLTPADGRRVYEAITQAA
jgi:hypothetical protein